MCLILDHLAVSVLESCMRWKSIKVKVVTLHLHGVCKVVWCMHLRHADQNAPLFSFSWVFCDRHFFSLWLPDPLHLSEGSRLAGWVHRWLRQVWLHLFVLYTWWTRKEYSALQLDGIWIYLCSSDFDRICFGGVRMTAISKAKVLSLIAWHATYLQLCQMHYLKAFCDWHSAEDIFAFVDDTKSARRRVGPG